MKNTLSIDIFDLSYPVDFSLYGIVSNQRPETICYWLNKHLAVEFQRADDIEIVHKKKGRLLFAKYWAVNEQDSIELTLYANIFYKNYLLKHFKGIDYILKVKGDYESFELHLPVDDIFNKSISLNTENIESLSNIIE